MAASSFVYLQLLTVMSMFTIVIMLAQAMPWRRPFRKSAGKTLSRSACTTRRSWMMRLRLQQHESPWTSQVSFPPASTFAHCCIMWECLFTDTWKKCMWRASSPTAFSSFWTQPSFINDGEKWSCVFLFLYDPLHLTRHRNPTSVN